MPKWKLIIIGVLIFSFPLPSLAAVGTAVKFLTSAYYSPLPGQSRYLRGNYEAEMRLNGRGTNGADGTPVFAGMIAAPKNYAFGTKIEIPGLGVGSVHDRGGAIINGKDYDRIDIWMGHGEEGLARALNWGMRTIVGTILENNNTEITLSYENVNLADIAFLPTNSSSTGSTGNSISSLQYTLASLGYLDTDPTGFYGAKTEQAVIDFQLAEGVIDSADDAGAGVFGPKTRSALNVILETQRKKRENFERIFPVGLEKEDTSEDVRRLQIMLRDFGFYQGEINGFYDEATEKAVKEFQLDKAVIGSENEAGAGRFGPKTHATLSKILTERRAQVDNFTAQSKLITLEGEKIDQKQDEIYNPERPSGTPVVKMRIFEI